MYDPTFIANMFEDQIVKGHFRWLARFDEIRRAFAVEGIQFSIYATGGLQEKGFFLSRIYSTLVVPKYKVHLLLHSAPEIDKNSLRKIIIALKRNFGTENWIFLVLMQKEKLGKALRESIEGIKDKTLGICAHSLGSGEVVTSDNFLGRGLAKQLRLGKVKYEKPKNTDNLPRQELLKRIELGKAEYGKFDVPNYLKSFTVTFALGISLLVFIGLSGFREAISPSTLPLTLTILLILSIIIGRVIYKSRYHVSVQIDRHGFKVREGERTRQRNWRDYSSLSLFISPQLETFLRLRSKEETLDLPISRPGIPRRELFEMAKQLIKSE